MGVGDWVRRVENEFFDGLEADESRQEKLALVTWIVFLAASLTDLFVGAVTGNWLFLLPGVLLLLATGLTFRNWRRLRSAAESSRR